MPISGFQSFINLTEPLRHITGEISGSPAGSHVHIDGDSPRDLQAAAEGIDAAELILDASPLTSVAVDAAAALGYGRIAVAGHADVAQLACVADDVCLPPLLLQVTAEELEDDGVRRISRLLAAVRTHYGLIPAGFDLLLPEHSANDASLDSSLMVLKGFSERMESGFGLRLNELCFRPQTLLAA
ncbi:hypothetical protein ACQQCD_00915 [Pseudarthrobacter sp. J1763]|uniref:hypothetical protein n=1 Tax=Pseudarthrobacter sp. J1763 TaxID=3420445 RepID=UPI003D293C43